MENTKPLYQLFNFFVGLVYVSIVLEIVLYLFYDLSFLTIARPLISKLWNIGIYQNIIYSKGFTLGLLLIATIGARPKKELDINIKKKIALPIVFGLIFFFGSLYFYVFNTNNIANTISGFEITYSILSFGGILLLNVGLDNFSKLMTFKIGDDVFNDENESFKQSTAIIENNYSVNLPMHYHHNGKTRTGWFNLTNPFRGTMVVGLPESGKSYSIIAPFIRQTMHKGFAQLIYDYKYPEFSKMAYYHFLMLKKNQTKNFDFHIVNLSDIEYSRRVNPIHPKYLNTLPHAIETAEALVYAIQKKSDGNGGGSDQFFTASFINFLAATFYFFSKFEGGKYSTLPHILFFLNRDYEEIFDLLTSNQELDSLLAPFLSAYKKKTFEQLEGQIGTLRVNLGKMNTKESAWIFSGDDVELNISNPKSPAYFVIANQKETQSTNAAINSLLLNRLTKLINNEGNIPITVSVDELPTIFFYKLQELLATARSNKVAVIVGLQELPQLVERYGRFVADTITSVIGNTISGAVRDTKTLQWLERLFGRSKQLKKGISINRKEVSTSVNEQMDQLIPSSKIANLNTGQIVAKLAPGFQDNTVINENLSTYKCTIDIDGERLKQQEKNYPSLPKYYNFKSDIHKEEILLKNYLNIKDEVDYLVNHFYQLND